MIFSAEAEAESRATLSAVKKNARFSRINSERKCDKTEYAGSCCNDSSCFIAFPDSVYFVEKWGEVV